MAAKAEIVAPGDRLGSIHDYIPGDGTYVRGDHVFASVLGSKAITASPSADSLPVLSISRAGATSSVPIIPSVGSVVTGRVTAITARAATVQIQVIDGVAVSHPFAGTLRQENLSLTDIDRTAMENCVRPGDVILAEVISLGDSRSYYLSIAKITLGVVFGRSREGKVLRPVSLTSMECPDTHAVFARKVKKALAEAKVLVIGAGGLGCELLKDLALSGFRTIHVIDMDTVDVTNLNRQFLFRAKDVGKPKAVVAAAFVEARVPGVSITAHVGPVQSQSDDFYKQFKVVLGGLDNLEARRWINAKLCSFVETDEDGSPVDPDQIIPFIDGGTEGFKGQVKLMLPKVSSCFECGLGAFPPETTFAMCTIASRPRKPEHCVAYAMMKSWDIAFSGAPDAENDGIVYPKPPPPNGAPRKYDTDSPEDMRWIYERAAERAAKFGIAGVDYMMTLGVVKNIIPAVASTNAIVSALAVGEALKLVTFASQSLNNFYGFMGHEGINSDTYCMEVKDNCLACKLSSFTLSVGPSTKLREILRLLETEKNLKKAALTAPGIGLLYMPTGKYLKETEHNLERDVAELSLYDGVEIMVEDETLPVGLVLKLNVTA